MTTPSLIIRPLASDEEYTAYFRMAVAAFSTHPSEEAVQRRKHSLHMSPVFRPEQVRGAFRDGQQVGGYIMHEHQLRMGSARISTGCIGTVVTSTQHRKQGIASALMQDAIEFAHQHNHALLLLDGIPNFYYRYDYIDMFDVSLVEVDRSAILARTPAAYQVRIATVDDAAALLALYKRHFQRYTGSFERSPELQAYRLQYTHNPTMVALSEQGQIIGYLRYSQEDDVHVGREIAADNWDALLALLQYHANVFDPDKAPTSLQYLLPLDSPMTQWMIDTLEVPDTSHWDAPSLEWGVRGMSYHHRFAGWMARLTDLHLLMRSILPELRARWRRSLAQWTGAISFSVAGEACTLQVAGNDVQIVATPPASTPRLELTAQAVVQLVFGYRALSQLTDLAHLSEEAASALSILFPTGHTWIPASDWF
ncbi:MAG: GNAT family N-acetyltransferase [Chloroflexota bacterium]|nr:GNAT family N-acetyltransferase [Chloroflexota bacterium]